MGWLLSCAIVATIVAPQDRARGGNERVVVVANGASGLSLALARRYAELRRIPIEQLLVLEDVPGGGTASAEPISLADCRERILAPILQRLEQRGLADEIDAIVYSSGFPHAVDVAAAAQDRKAPQEIGGVAALTGLTYFARAVVKNDLSCLDLEANAYCKGPLGGNAPPSRGFGEDRAGRGRHYLSTFLAWLGPYGTSFAEAIANLERSAAADGTNPRGTIYFLKNGDVRATTREPLFAAAVRELEQRGRAAMLLEPGKDGQDGILPKGRSDVLGAMIGIADFDWNASGSTILPGAIVEHLTSFGATFQLAGQTKLTALLRAGAAGASGTVTEPYAIQKKFPTPFVQVHYVDGCTLAEAFFASVAGPYQLLVVGDACCRPFARFAEIELPGLAAPNARRATGDSWRGTVTLAPAVVKGEATRFEAWIDGRPVAAAAVGAELAIDTTTLTDGAHELHLVAVGPAPIGTTSSLVRRVAIENGPAGTSQSVTVSGPAQPIELGGMLKLQGNAPAGAKVELLEGERRLVEVDGRVGRGGSWRAELPTALLGPGPCALHARATTDSSTPSARVQSETFVATIVVPTIPTSAKTPGELLPGLAFDVGAKPKEEKLGILSWSDALPIATSDDSGPPAHGTVRGWIKLPSAGLHEWGVAGGTLIGFALDGRRWLTEAPTGTLARVASFDAELAAGWHSFELEIRSDGAHAPRLSLVGPSGPVALAEGTFGHGPPGLKRLQKDRLAPEEPGWCDGIRTVAVSSKKGVAEVELRGGSVRIEAVALFLQSADAHPGRLREGVVLEGRDGGAWGVLPAGEIRVIHGSTTANPPIPAECVLWTGMGRRVRRLRIRAAEHGTDVLSGLCEIEAWEAEDRR